MVLVLWERRSWLFISLRVENCFRIVRDPSTPCPSEHGILLNSHSFLLFLWLMGSKMHKHTGTTYCKEHPSHPPQIPPFWPVGDGAASSTFLPGALGQDQRNPGKKGTEKVGNRFPEASETHHRLAPRMGVPTHTLAAEQSVGLPSAMGCLQGAVFGSCWAAQVSSSFPFQERVEAHVHLCTHSHQLTSWNSKIHIFLSLFPPTIILALTPSCLFPTSLCTSPPECLHL